MVNILYLLRKVSGVFGILCCVRKYIWILLRLIVLIVNLSENVRKFV